MRPVGLRTSILVAMVDGAGTAGDGFMRRRHPHLGLSSAKYEYDRDESDPAIPRTSRQSTQLSSLSNVKITTTSRVGPGFSSSVVVQIVFFSRHALSSGFTPQQPYLLELSAMISVVHSGDCSVRSWWWYHMVM